MSDKPLISFDYAIKYLLRTKSDYDIVEGFISALLATEGIKPVKINALLDSESNKESRDLKQSIADLVVEDEDGNKYIVEIERSFTNSFMHKACFNSSRLVVDSIYGNQDYNTIKKIYHISLLYFSTQGMKTPLYHGKTIIHEVENKHPVDLNIANQGLVMFEQHNIFPEYFFISIPLFNDVVKQEFDEWLYMLKHSEVKDDFKSPYMAKVREKLSVLKMSNQERTEYFKYLKESITTRDSLTAAEEKGLAKGMEKGMEKKAINMAIKMLAKGLPMKEIAEFTDLTVERIRSLKK